VDAGPHQGAVYCNPIVPTYPHFSILLGNWYYWSHPGAMADFSYDGFLL